MKRRFSLLLCIALVLTLVLPAGAEDLGGFLYSMVYSDETALCLLSMPATEGRLTLEVNGADFSDFSVAKFSETGLGVTYYCMVDQSSSFSMDQKNQQLRGLTALSNSLRPQDRMILVTMGNTLSFGEPLTDQEARQKAIEEACVYTSYSTALYDNIISTVRTAAQDQGSESLNCVVLFTDGLDNTQRTGGKEEVTQAVRDSGVSFNAISVMTPTNEQFVVNNARQMVLFAQESMGGIGIVPALDKEEASTNVEDAVADIVNQMLSISLIRLNAASLPRGGNLEVTAVWKLKTDKRESSITVESSLLPPEPTEPETTLPEPTQPETTQPEVVETVAPETTAPAPRPATSNRGNTLLLLALLCFAGVVILTVVAVVLLLRQRREQGSPEEREYMEEDSRFIPQSSSTEDVKLDFSGLDSPEKRKAAPVPSPSPVVTASACQVWLVPEGYDQGGVDFTIEANDSVTLGRNSKAQIILNETDTALSGLHFELQWDSRALHLRDRNSTNGTALNGTPLRPDTWVRVENQAVIQAGAMEYTVFVEKK